MDKVMDWLWDTWDSEGIVPELHTIEEALEEEISHDEALDIPKVVKRFMELIRVEEGVILYGKQLSLPTQTGMEIQAN